MYLCLCKAAFMKELYYAFEITPFIEYFENKHFYIVVISPTNVYAIKISLIKSLSKWNYYLLVFFFPHIETAKSFVSEKASRCSLSAWFQRFFYVAPWAQTVQWAGGKVPMGFGRKQQPSR